MNLKKEIFERISAIEKVELSEVKKIELALKDDFDTVFNKANDDNAKIGTTLIDNLSKAETNYKQNLQVLQNAKKIGDELISKAKDLGLDLPQTDLNRIKTIDMMVKETQGILAKISQMYSIF
jgi:uncharacterized Zn finger protein